jgi:hypothetical protein
VGRSKRFSGNYEFQQLTEKEAVHRTLLNIGFVKMDAEGIYIYEDFAPDVDFDKETDVYGDIICLPVASVPTFLKAMESIGYLMFRHGKKIKEYAMVCSELNNKLMTRYGAYRPANVMTGNMKRATNG